MARAKPTHHGVLVVDKPRGVTSHDVVARIRRIAEQREVGHAGTLDPMASGVLVVLLGEATKLTPWLTADAKRYACTLKLGVETSSGDADGPVTRREPIDAALRQELRAIQCGLCAPVIEDAMRNEREREAQVPPAVSAIHVDGERAYARVRRGERVELDARPVHVHDLRVEGADADLDELRCTLHTSKGYYVRAFARDFAASLGTVAHLVALRRLGSGGFGLQDARPLEGLTRDAMAAALVPCEVAAARLLPSVRLDELRVRDVRQGKRFPWPSEADTSSPHALLGPAGDLVAVAEAREGLTCVIRGFFAEPARSG